MDPVFVYPAASAEIVMRKRMEVISNNLANVDTTGFKKDIPIFGTVVPTFAKINSMGESRDGTGRTSIIPIPSFAIMAELAVNFDHGNIHTTDAPLDVAIEGEGFFQVETPIGTLYTRNGAFTMTSERQLVTRSGQPVLGTDGPITLPSGLVNIDDQGKISVREDGASISTEVDTLALVEISDLSRMQKVTDGLFKLMKGGEAIPMPEEKVRVRQGALEASNVDPVKEMVAMIFAIRQYEATQKAIQTAEEVEVANANKVGVLRQ